MRFRKELVGTATIPIVLSILSRGENYGYEIARAVNVETDGALEWREGTLYPALHKMEKDGLIASTWRQSDTGRKRKYYRLTDEGHKALERHTAEWSAFTGAVGKILGDAS